MKAEILAVGTELLMGQIANTNAQYISSRLPDAGIGVYYHSVVGDNPQRLRECLKLALNRSDIVITTGGLGPTKDDLTKEIISSELNRKLILDEDILNTIKSFFKKFNRPMTENNLKQAYIPENSIIIKNSNGTAPGCIIEEGEKTVIMLPGPPSEMKPMFEQTVMPFLRSKSSNKLKSVYMRIFGIGESAMEDKIQDIVDSQDNPTIAPYAKEGEVTLRITAKYSQDEDPDAILKPIIEEISKRLGDTVYSLENKDLHVVVTEMLIDRNITIAVAESCTGGLICSKITEVPGCSKIFLQGEITYSNQSKQVELSVCEKTILHYGAVSHQTAKEMASGMKNKAGTDIAVAVTGIAGPDGATPDKPVGLVYIALAHSKGVDCKELKLWGDRNRIRNVTCLYVFDMIRKHLLNTQH